MTINLFQEDEVRAASRLLVLKISNEVAELIPSAKIEEIGATSIPGSVTKGDVDVAVFVEKKVFEDAKVALSTVYDVNEMEYIEYFASFKGMRSNIHFGIQLTTPNERNFRFVEFRDALRASPKLVQEYNLLKSNARDCTMDEYRARKYEFIEAVLADHA